MIRWLRKRFFGSDWKSVPSTRLGCPPIYVWQDMNWAAFVGRDWPREILGAVLTDRLHRKQSRSIARWTLRCGAGDLTVFAKRHYRHSPWRALLARLFPDRRWSDAGREREHLLQAGHLGIPTPKVVALAEWRPSQGRLQSVIVLEELDGMVALHEAIPLAAKHLPRAEFRRWKSGLIPELVRLVRLLHDRNLFHSDLYLCHFFVAIADVERPPHDWNGRVTMIDFHRLTRRLLLPMAGRVKDLAQLLYSARVPGITAGDVIRFWKLYRGGRRQRLLGRLIRYKSNRYIVHNKKRSHK